MRIKRSEDEAGAQTPKARKVSFDEYFWPECFPNPGSDLEPPDSDLALPDSDLAPRDKTIRVTES